MMTEIDYVIVNVNGEAFKPYDFCSSERAQKTLDQAQKEAMEKVEYYNKEIADHPNHDNEYLKLRKKEYETAKYEMMTFADYLRRKKKIMTSGDVTEVTADEYYYVLNIMPPIQMSFRDGMSLFCVSEMKTDTYTTQYAEIGDRYYSATVDLADESTWINRRVDIGTKKDYVVANVDREFFDLYDFCTPETAQEMIEKATKEAMEKVEYYNKEIIDHPNYNEYSKSRKKEYETAKYEMMTFEEYLSKKKEIMISADVKEVTIDAKREYWALGQVRSPIYIGDFDGMELYCRREMVIDTCTIQYAEIEDHCYSAIVDITDESTWINKRIDIVKGCVIVSADEEDFEVYDFCTPETAQEMLEKATKETMEYAEYYNKKIENYQNGGGEYLKSYQKEYKPAKYEIMTFEEYLSKKEDYYRKKLSETRK